MSFPLRTHVAALILFALAVPSEAKAQRAAVTTLQVSVRVVRSCSVNADSSAVDASSSVRVVCGRSALRALRVSTTPDAAENVTPVLTAGPQRLAGGELIFTVPTAILITLDF